MSYKSSIAIADRKISTDNPPYVIAELSANHNGTLKNALKIIEEASKAGADAVKLQTYRPDTMTIDSDLDDFQIRGGPWDGLTLYKLYEKAHMPWEWHKPIFDYARELGITVFSSPFDKTAVDLLENLNAPAYKIASFEVIDLDLIEYTAQTGKPLIISTGMASLEDIDEAIEVAYGAGCKEMALLHCVSSYPAPALDYNLKTIADMACRFGVPIGLSDHTLSNVTAIASISLGAAIIEKHVTLDRSGGGPDDSFSLEPNQLRELCRDVYEAWEAQGIVNYDVKVSENENKKFRRSLYFVKEMTKGDSIGSDCIKAIRPGYGLHPKELKNLLGKRVKRDVISGTAVTYEDVEYGA